jgi:hypothetical protein
MGTKLEDWEHGDEPENAGWSGDTGEWDNQTSTVYEGSYAIEYLAGSDDNSITRTDKTVEQGDLIETYHYMPNLNNYQANYFYFGLAQNSSPFSNSYTLSFAGYNGEMTIWVDGSSLVSDTNVNYPIGEWMRATVDWATDGNITATLYDASDTQLSQISATDTTYTSGGVGFRGFDQPCYFDLLGKNPPYITAPTVDTLQPQNVSL